MCKNLTFVILFFLGEFSNIIVTIGNFVITICISKKCVPTGISSVIKTRWGRVYYGGFEKGVKQA